MNSTYAQRFLFFPGVFFLQHGQAGSDKFAKLSSKPSGAVANCEEAARLPARGKNNKHFTQQNGCFFTVIRGSEGAHKKLPEKDALTMAYMAIDQGACGVDMGRNIFQADAPRAMLQAVRAVVHDGLTAEAALELYQDLQSKG